MMNDLGKIFYNLLIFVFIVSIINYINTWMKIFYFKCDKYDKDNFIYVLVFSISMLVSGCFILLENNIWYQNINYLDERTL
jgi:Ca2+/Na+ antiporter